MRRLEVSSASAPWWHRWCIRCPDRDRSREVQIKYLGREQRIHRLRTTSAGRVRGNMENLWHFFNILKWSHFKIDSEICSETNKLYANLNRATNPRSKTQTSHLTQNPEMHLYLKIQPYFSPWQFPVLRSVSGVFPKDRVSGSPPAARRPWQDHWVPRSEWVPPGEEFVFGCHKWQASAGDWCSPLWEPLGLQGQPVNSESEIKRAKVN